jgi:surface protein
MNAAFFGCASFNQDLSFWDVSKVTAMDHTFQGCTSFEGKGLETWDVINVQTAKGTFMGAKSLETDLCPWGEKLQLENTKDATQDMFRGARSCLSKDDPNFSVSPPGPFCHWCETRFINNLMMEEERLAEDFTLEHGAVSSGDSPSHWHWHAGGSSGLVLATTCWCWVLLLVVV